MLIWCRLLMHCVLLAASLALLRAGSSIAARMAMMAMTTSNSISVKPAHSRQAGKTHRLSILNLRFSIGGFAHDRRGPSFVIFVPLQCSASLFAASCSFPHPFFCENENSIASQSPGCYTSREDGKFQPDRE